VAHTSCGRSTAGCRFFESLADRFGADGPDQPQDDHLVGQQLQGPVTAALGRVAAGQADEHLLEVSLDLDLVGSARLGFAVEGRGQSLGDEALADPGNGPGSHPQRGDDGVIALPGAEGVVGQQEDAGVGQLAGRRLARRHPALQFGSLVALQRHPVLVHRRTPLLDPRA